MMLSTPTQQSIATLGFTIHYRDEIPSTNTWTIESSGHGPDRQLFWADRQTAGRGRTGAWDSPEGNLAFSLLFRNHGIPLRHQPKLSLAIGIALVRVMGVLMVGGAALKWPNDLYIHGKKVAGILIEEGMAGSGDLVVGIGLNVNSRLDDFPEAERAQRTTLREVAGHPFDIEGVLCRIVEHVAAVMGEAKSEYWLALLSEYRRYSFLSGKEITVDGTPMGFVTGIDDEGCLTVQAPDGSIRRIVAGEVRIRAAQ